MQNIYRRNTGDSRVDRPVDSFSLGTGNERPKCAFWKPEMKLSHLINLHRLIFAGAILAALFMGMTFEYSIKQAEQRGMVKVYTTMSIRSLADIEI